MKTKMHDATLEDDTDVSQTEAMKPDDASSASAVEGSAGHQDGGVAGESDDVAAPTSDGAVADDAGTDAGLKSASGPRRVSVNLKTLVAAGLVGALVAATATMAWLYLRERGQLQAEQRQAAGNQRAEQIALDYAVGAAKVNYQDLNAWKDNLTHGTSAHLSEKLNKAATQMRQLFIPLEWDSDATPLAAKVRSHTDGVYVVDTFVSVSTKTTQMPESVPSTATYSITIDSHDNWQISDVGGIGALAGPK
ncbi:hypothetical protein ACAG26_15170 [Mycobacterium sp. pUA109]|uniref:hypothetical protein n=1 Tax=Mycobacterium sp. pUA109 TaxID=3238982 RepID=UPI00351B37D8